jgi:hypothetical protein
LCSGINIDGIIILSAYHHHARDSQKKKKNSGTFPEDNEKINLPNEGKNNGNSFLI